MADGIMTPAKFANHMQRHEILSGLEVIHKCGASFEPWIEDHFRFLSRLPVSFKSYKQMLLRLYLGDEAWGLEREVYYKIGEDQSGRSITEKYTPDEIFKAVALEVVWERYLEKQ